MAGARSRRPTRKGCPNRSREFKREIAAAACEPGISVARLALERGINANLLFKWRRFYRAGKYGPPDPRHLPVPGARSLPVSRRAPAAPVRLLPVELSAPLDVRAPNGAIEVVFRDATVRISGAPEPATLRLVLDTLARSS